MTNLPISVNLDPIVMLRRARGSLPQAQAIAVAAAMVEEMPDSVRRRLRADKRWQWQALIARDEQLVPAGDWLTWLIKAGRGWGKTRTGAETVCEWAESGTYGKIELIGATAADARDVMVEGPSGIVSCSSEPKARYRPSLRRVDFHNGAQCTLYSAEEPERLRGPEHDAGWWDEVAAWKRLRETLDNASFGLRIGKRPRKIITTTPKPLRILREMMRNAVVTGGKTRDNAENLAASFLEDIERRYAGTRLGRQELDGELLEDIAGALWTHEQLDDLRVSKAPDLVRPVVAVDPSGGEGADHDAQGIGAAGLGVDDHLYALADRTCSLSPQGWGRRTVETAIEFEADAIVYEKNFGGDMVKSTLEQAQKSLGNHTRLVGVTASKGKHVRAEPIAAIYEQKRAHHVGEMDELEDELVQFTPQGYTGDRSPNRADWLIWAMTELLGGKRVVSGWSTTTGEVDKPGRGRLDW